MGTVNTNSDIRDLVFLTRKDVMQILQISYSQCDKLFHTKDFPKVLIGGKAVVSKENFEAYMDKYIGRKIPVNESRC